MIISFIEEIIVTGHVLIGERGSCLKCELIFRLKKFRIYQNDSRCRVTWNFLIKNCLVLSISDSYFNVSLL